MNAPLTGMSVEANVRADNEQIMASRLDEVRPGVRLQRGGEIYELFTAQCTQDDDGASAADPAPPRPPPRPSHALLVAGQVPDEESAQPLPPPPRPPNPCLPSWSLCRCRARGVCHGWCADVGGGGGRAAFDVSPVQRPSTVRQAKNLPYSYFLCIRFVFSVRSLPHPQAFLRHSPCTGACSKCS